MPADDFSSTIYHVLYGTREEVLKCSLQVSPLLADFAQMHCVIASRIANAIAALCVMKPPFLSIAAWPSCRRSLQLHHLSQNPLQRHSPSPPKTLHRALLHPSMSCRATRSTRRRTHLSTRQVGCICVGVKCLSTKELWSTTVALGAL